MIDVSKSGKKIFSILIDHFGSVNAIAEYLGISITAVYHWKYGNKIPSIDNLVLISDATRCPINDMIIRRSYGEKKN